MTEQRPIGSPFGAASTADEVMAGQDLAGKVAIVTGGYSGIGLVTARALARAGAEVIVPARDRAKAEAAIGRDWGIVLEALDLIDPASIDGFAHRFAVSGRPLHLLINNAGIMAAPLTRDARGFESQFATNHLGHFQLTARLWPQLAEAEGARVVQVSSLAHAKGPQDFTDPNYEQRPYDPWDAYAQAKIANILFALELDKRGRSRGVRAFSLHPGAIVTDLGRFIGPESLAAAGLLDAAGKPVIDPASGKKSPEQGAATTLWCATSPLLDGKGGVYCEDCEVAPIEPAARSAAGPSKGVRPWAVDPDVAARLWATSERLTEAKLP